MDGLPSADLCKKRGLIVCVPVSSRGQSEALVLCEPSTPSMALSRRLHKVGEDRSERQNGVSSRPCVNVTAGLKYACRTNADDVVQTPAWLFPGGMPTEATLAYVLVSTYADRLPAYRQSQILAQAGPDLHRAVLADWVGNVAFPLRPVVDRLADHLRRSGQLFMDETTAPLLDPRRGTATTGYVWALARDDRPWGGEDPSGVVHFCASGRAGEMPEPC